MIERTKLVMHDPRQGYVLLARLWALVKPHLERLEPVHIEIKGATRSLEANAKMWAMLTDISSQVEWYGQRLCKEDFKTILTASLRKQRAVPGIDIGTFVILGDRTSEMTKADMSELIELAYAFGAERGVVWSEADHDTGEIGRAA